MTFDTSDKFLRVIEFNKDKQKNKQKNTQRNDVELDTKGVVCE